MASSSNIQNNILDLNLPIKQVLLVTEAVLLHTQAIFTRSTFKSCGTISHPKVTKEIKITQATLYPESSMIQTVKVNLFSKNRKMGIRYLTHHFCYTETYSRFLQAICGIYILHRNHAIVEPVFLRSKCIFVVTSGKSTQTGTDRQINSKFSTPTIANLCSLHLKDAHLNHHNEIILQKDYCGEVMEASCLKDQC